MKGGTSFRSRPHHRWTARPLCLVVALVVGLGASAFGVATPHALALPASPYPVVPTRTLGGGAWSWFEGPRAMVARDGCEVLAASDDDSTTHGNVNVSSWRLGPQTGSEVTLDMTLAQDDHNSAGLVELRNREVLAAWSAHGADERVRVAVRSTTGKWTRLRGFSTPGVTTYNNLYQLSDGAILDFVRHPTEPSGGSNPDVYRSRDNGRTWRPLGELLHFTGAPTTKQRPYVRYAQLGDRIFFIATQGHPRELAAVGIDAAIFAGYVEGTTVYRSDDTAVGAVGAGVEVDVLTQVYFPAPHQAAWTAEISFGPDGNPIARFSIRNRDVAWSSAQAIRYAQARYGTGGWIVHELAPGGRAIYAAEDDYSGNLASDPLDPDHVVVSSTVDPTTLTDLGQYDLFEGHSVDGGITWSWVDLTNSAVNEYRPTFTNPADGVQALLWFAGRYDTYSKYRTTVQYRLADARSPAARAARCGHPRDLDAQLATGDFDGDSRTDVLSYRAGAAGDRISWGAPRPDALVAGQSTEVNGSYQPVAGDFDGDTRTDILWYAPGTTPDFTWWANPNRSFASAGGPWS